MGIFFKTGHSNDIRWEITIEFAERIFQIFGAPDSLIESPIHAVWKEFWVACALLHISFGDLQGLGAGKGHACILQPRQSMLVALRGVLHRPVLSITDGDLLKFYDSILQSPCQELQAS